MKNLFIHLILVGLLCCIVFSYNASGLFIPYDGSYREEIIKRTFEWTRPTINASLNPLQGLGDLAFPFNFWLSPACLINYCFFNTSPSPILIYSIITLELFLAVYWLASCLNINNAARPLAAWLAIIFIMPFIAPANSGGLLSFYAITSIIPDIVENIAIVILILGLITKLDLIDLPLTLRYSLAISVLIIYLITQFPIMCILGLPLIALFSLYWFSFQISGIKSLCRMALSLIVIYCPSILPCIFVAGWFIDCPAALFPHDFAPDRPTWVFISILFHGPAHFGWMSTIIFLSGLAGAILVIIRKTGPLVNIAIFYIIYSLLLLLSGVLFTFVLVKYRVPSALYYEWFIWPFMFLYTSILLQECGSFIAHKGRLLLNLHAPGIVGIVRSQAAYASRLTVKLRAPAQVAFIYGCGLGLLICALSVALYQQRTSKPTPPIYPPLQSDFNRELIKHVGLTPDSDWKGCVATLTECKDPNTVGTGTSWVDQYTWDYKIWDAAGSEYRGVCLWWQDIPTLFVYSTTMSPDYYFMMTRLFASPKDAQQRSVLVLTQPNIKLLSLFGVKIVITDKALPFDNALQGIYEPEPPKNVFAYELKDSNISGFSPSKITQCASAQETLARMRSPDFEPLGEAIVYENLPSDLTSADTHTMVWKKNAVRIKADAPGMCLLVLPLQYSHCIRLTSKDKTGVQARLIRVDMTLTGILFSKHLDAIISPHYGPFTNVLGKFKDYADLKRLQLN